MGIFLCLSYINNHDIEELQVAPNKGEYATLNTVNNHYQVAARSAIFLAAYHFTKEGPLFFLAHKRWILSRFYLGRVSLKPDKKQKFFRISPNGYYHLGGETDKFISTSREWIGVGKDKTSTVWCPYLVRDIDWP